MKTISKLLLNKWTFIGLTIIASVLSYGSVSAYPLVTQSFAQSQSPTQSPISISPLPKVSTDSSEVAVVLNIVFALIGALCVLIITIAGFRYIVSRGESQNISKAKDTILYALIGLIIAILADTIVNFVVGRI